MHKALVVVGLLLMMMGGVTGCGQDQTESEGWPPIDNSADEDVSTSRDAGESDTGRRDAEPDDAGGDADAGDVADTGDDDVDTGGNGGSCDGRSEDSDGDGLLDCEEEQLCTDPDEADTDDDGLDDMDELVESTDPCAADTDDDGLDDGDELDIGLDPTRESTFDDGIEDWERWVVDACEGYREEASDDHRVTLGSLAHLVVPEEFDETSLDIDDHDADSHDAVFVDHTERDVRGFYFAEDYTAESSTRSDAVQYLSEHREAIDDTARIVSEYNGGDLYAQTDLLDGETESSEEETPRERNGRRRALARYRIEWPEAASAETVREELLYDLSPFDPSQVSEVPESADGDHTEFHVELSVHLAARGTDAADDDAPAVTSLSVAPASQVDDDLQGRMRAAVDSTNVEYVSEMDVHCELTTPDDAPEVDVYIVLDTSDATNEHADHIDEALEELHARLDDSFFNARFGLTTMDPERQGELRKDVGWLTDRDDILDEADALRDASHSDEDPDGIEAARAGIGTLSDPVGEIEELAFREDAQVLTVFLTDRRLEDFDEQPSFFRATTVVFAGVGGGDDCCGADGDGYAQLADATGGAHTAVDDERLDQALARFALDSGDRTRPYGVSSTDASAAMEIFKDGSSLDWNASGGAFRAPRSDSLVFTGQTPPDTATESGETPDYIARGYHAFDMPEPPPPYEQ